MRRLGCFSVWLLSATSLAADGEPAIQEALAALRRGDFAAAEQTLQAAVRSHPDDAGALSLLGVALDGLRKFPEAGEMHRRAAAAAPNSPDVWSNYANHLLGTGDEAGARKSYLRVVALDAGHFNANVQLTRIAVKHHNGTEALGYLGHLPAAQQEAPNLARSPAGIALSGGPNRRGQQAVRAPPGRIQGRPGGELCHWLGPVRCR